ncbi:branched-chain amino acid ABC transporter permease [Bosea sp. BK604]|uniref:branched-chain amino acid ABC transporter permease n=1 Tax=Bosea sp. BK604 TaxID=2512180 RepID=UPI0020C09E8B|nr:branched-chain amino acid ABC transporter permease [Bosea sp. BK604]
MLLTRPAGFLGRNQAAPTGNSFLADAVSLGARRWTKPVEIALLAFACVAPFFIYPLFLSKVLCFALFGAAFALLAGHVGLLSFGHAAYFGAGAYVTAYTAKAWALPPELAILLGTGVAALFGLLFGWLAIRRSGIYFAMVTLALSQLIFFVALQAKWTGGEDGIQAVPRGRLFGLVDLEQPLAIYFFTLVVFVACFLLIRRITSSPFGQVLKATAQNEARVISLGYKVQRAKLLAFVLSAALAGLAGSMKALVVKLASLADVHWSMSGEVLLISLIGGLGSLLGPIFGSFVLIGIGDYLAAAGAWVTVLQGLIFVFSVLLFRRGLVGGLDDLFGWFARRRGKAAAPLAIRPAAGE